MSKKAVLTSDVAAKVLTADLANILKKAKSGKPLTKYERDLIAESEVKEEEQKYFDSMKQAAAALGLPLSLLKKAKRAGCTAFQGSRVYREDLLAWVEAAGGQALHPNGAEGGREEDKGYWEGRIARQKFEREAWEFSKARGEYTKNSIFSGELLALAGSSKALLRQKLENEYPGLCPGLEGDQRAFLKKVGRELVDELCERMQRLVDKWGQQAEGTSVPAKGEDARKRKKSDGRRSAASLPGEEA
jgi:hypothetical protein